MENNIFKRVITTIAFIIMITINIFANLIPLNGMTTGEISDIYPSMITPSSFTFSIWSVIYILLLIFTVYQIGFFQNKRGKLKTEAYNNIRLLYIITSLCNAAWIIAWHFEFIALALMLLVIIVVCLSIINRTLYTVELSKQEKCFIRIPFSIYFGWVSIAVVTNAAVLLVSIRWDRFGLSEAKSTIFGCALIFIITSYVLVKYYNFAFSISVIWAFAGLLVKQIAVDELNGQYPGVMICILGCVILLVLEIGYIALKMKRYT